MILKFSSCPSFGINRPLDRACPEFIEGLRAGVIGG
jgi:hypothetical protein